MADLGWELGLGCITPMVVSQGCFEALRVGESWAVSVGVSEHHQDFCLG